MLSAVAAQAAESGGANGGELMIAPAAPIPGTVRVLALMFALMLGGCAGVTAMQETRRLEAEGNVPPANHRAEVVALMRTYLNDPTNVRGAFITEPEIRDVGRGQRRYAVCLRYDARTGEGSYAGSKDSLVTFWRGRLDRIIDDGREPCRSADYRPFPKLEAMTR